MITHHIRFDDEHDALYLLDQRYLPTREEWFKVDSLATCIEALQVMVIRGAPAIGVTAAYGCYICCREVEGAGDWKGALHAKLDELANARPTAVNLAWAVKRLRAMWEQAGDVSLDELKSIWLAEAKRMQIDDEQINKNIGTHGATLLEDGDRVMTHCNAGALATAGWGTALGVIYSAVEAGKKVTVVANETRPFLQGARLTAWELDRSGVGVTVACDNACGLLMRKGLVDKVVVGADRVAANGDVANKIGTYSVAVLAREHNIPFYVAAPASTFDLDTPTGDEIPIEDRTPREVTHPTNESAITPDNVAVYNYAFDITPNHLITALISDKGIINQPYTENIRKLLGGA